MKRILVIGPASQMLGIRIKKELELESVDTETKNFPDGENYLRINIENEKLFEKKEAIIK